MKIKITTPNSIYGSDGEDMFGKTMTVKGDVPPGWQGKYQIISGGPSDDAQLMTDNEKLDEDGTNDADVTPGVTPGVTTPGTVKDDDKTVTATTKPASTKTDDKK